MRTFKEHAGALGTGPGEVGPERFTATVTGIDTQQIGRKPVLGGLINEYTHAA